MKALLLALFLVGCVGSVQPQGRPDLGVVDASSDLVVAPPRDLALPSHPSSEFGLPIDLGSGLPQCGVVRGPLVVCQAQNGKPELAPDGLICLQCDVALPCETWFAGLDSVCLQSCGVCRFIL